MVYHTMSLNKIGLRINTDFQRVEKNWIERARKIQISNVGDVCFRLQGFHAGFNQYGKKKKFGSAGTAAARASASTASAATGAAASTAARP